MITLRNGLNTLSSISQSPSCPILKESVTVEPLAIPLTRLSDEEIEIQEIVKRLANEKIRPLVKQMDETSKLDKTIIDSLFENGLMSVNIENRFDGTGSTFFSLMLVIEQLAKVDPAVSAFVGIHSTLVVQTLNAFGSEEQKSKYLPLLAKDTVGSFCLSEPNAGSDAFSMKTMAVKDGDYYVINGSKQWITNAKEADVFVVFANVNPEAGYKGITCFIVERNTPGLTVAKAEDKLGIRCSSTCPVIFDSVRVPTSAVVGHIGQGYKYAMHTMNIGRIGIGAQMLGLAEGCFEEAVKYTFDRKQFGRRIFDFQAMQHQISQIATRIESAKLLVYNAARLRDAGLPFTKEAAMAKYYAAEVATHTTSKAVEWLGGVGFTRDFPIEKYYRDCKIGAIYEGTSNIQLNTIAKLIDREFN
ncbi:short/branched chain specific acyl-CoA dehydrogenase, mitochondrial-like [Oppia nitens]|uniref:short/branched chain specific acyl-CoA dehydrogenase, mitochondrial-like n=1 Tax=Oppia nitens TaxID=1686743 RepID=UPI0023DBA38B|nr:short/branched chain specific acyl-CoA dehydrogenase, mitochondrial-like [Oppia nitens]